MKWINVIALMAIEAVLLCAGVSLASRNASGTMARINGPYTAGGVISSSVINARLDDIENELTYSLSTLGKGGMASPVRGADGTNTAPTYSFTSETSAGFFRNGSADLRMTFNGTLAQRWTSSNLYLSLPLTSAAGSYPLQITGPASDQTVALFGATSRTPIGIYAHATVPNITSNATNDGTTGWKYATSNSAQALDMEMGSGGFNFFIAPSGTAGNAITFTKYANISTSGLTIGNAGTAISSSVAGTLNWNPGTVNANTCANTTYALTGATTTGACVVSLQAQAANNSTFNCSVSTSGTVAVTTCAIGVQVVWGASNFSIRVFNP